MAENCLSERQEVAWRGYIGRRSYLHISFLMTISLICMSSCVCQLVFLGLCIPCFLKNSYYWVCFHRFLNFVFLGLFSLFPLKILILECLSLFAEKKSYSWVCFTCFLVKVVFLGMFSLFALKIRILGSVFLVCS